MASILQLKRINRSLLQTAFVGDYLNDLSWTKLVRFFFDEVCIVLLIKSIIHGKGTAVNNIDLFLCLSLAEHRAFYSINCSDCTSIISSLQIRLMWINTVLLTTVSKIDCRLT